MPTYPYHCKTCDNSWDVIKRVKDIDDPENCPKCHKVGDRQIALTNLGEVPEVGSHWHPAVGRVKSRRELKEKTKGMIEVGTEKPETIHKHFSKQREETRNQRYEDAMRVKVYE